MLLIPCPWCGPRDETEFKYGGQAHLPYPDDPAALSDEAWADFLFMRDNPRRTVVGAVDACRRVSPVVQRGAGHRHEPDLRVLSDRRVAARGARLMGSRRLDKAVTASIASAPVEVTFEGRPLRAFAGDTLASALLANGVDVVCPSPILGRPRGVFSAGVEEPCAFVEVTAPSFEPIMPAPMVKVLDHLGAVGRPGVGVLADGDDGIATADHRHVHVDTLVVGGGAAGLREALAAVRRGDRTMLVDERHWLGGTASSDDTIDGIPALAWIDDVAGELRTSPDTAVLTEATALGVYDDGYVVVFERSAPVATLWHVRAGRVVLATGAHERPIAFADCDRPGVMLASAAVTYADRFGVAAGERAVVFTTNHAGHDAATLLAAAGIEIAAVIDVSEGGPASDAMRALGVDVRNGWAVTGTEGDPRVSAVHVAGPGGAAETIEADLLLVSGGWNPVTQLWRGIGGGLRFDEGRACFIPDGAGPPWLSIVGAAAGEVPTSVPFWFTPAQDLSRHYVDLQRDSTVADVLEAVGHDLHSTEHVKRATYIGTAIDQGRTSGVLTAAIVNQAWGDGPGAQGPTNARPPYTPVPYAVLAGRDRGPVLLDPVRTTPIHDWHVEHGAAFENVGQWKRPWYFPAGGESMDEAVATGVARGAERRRRAGRVDARQDRGRRPRCGGVPGPHVHEPDVDPGRGVDPLRPDAGARRHGVRRRRRDAAGRGPLLRHHDDGRRRQRARPVRGVAPDRMARSAGVLHQRHRAVGHRGRERAARAGTDGRAGDRHAAGRRGVPVHDGARRHGGRHARAHRPRELHRRARRTRSTWRAGSAARCGRP